MTKVHCFFNLRLSIVIILSIFANREGKGSELKSMDMNAVIIEDECLAATELETLLKEVAPDIKIEVKLDSVADSVKWLEKEPDGFDFYGYSFG